MSINSYWKNYVYETDAEQVQRKIRQTTFSSRGLNLGLKYFEKGKDTPSILWVPGTGSYSLYLSELGYHMHLRGYNTFGIDFQGHGDSEGKRGDFTVNELTQNCIDAATYIANYFNDRIGTIGISLGGLVAFYLGLTNGPVKSVVCQNGGILIEKRFHDEVIKRRIPTIAKMLARLAPGIKISPQRYLDIYGMAETEREKKHAQNYLNDPNVVRGYTLRAVFSQIQTSPPNPVEKLVTPTMFLAPTRDWLMSVSYVRDLHDRLPQIKKKLIELDGGHFWVSSHPREAANIICDWFDETL